MLQVKLQLQKIVGDEKGSVLVYVAISLLALLWFFAMAIDVGYLMASKNQLQNTADACALAATGELGDQLWKEEPVDEGDIRSAAQEVASQNYAGGKSLNLPDSDIEIGVWNSETRTFSPLSAVGGTPDAVRVTARRDDSANGPITSFFAKLLGKDTFEVAADSTAALIGGPPFMDKGKVEIPVGISEQWFENNAFGENIKFHPTPGSCAGYHVFNEGHAASANPPVFWDLCGDLINRTYESPMIIAGETTLKFSGGTGGSATFDHKNKDDLEDLYEDRRWDEEPHDEWKTPIVVYEDNNFGCDNPNGSTTIVGFATVIVKKVMGPSAMVINATVIDEAISDSRGNGPYYGTVGRIPGLVE